MHQSLYKFSIIIFLLLSVVLLHIQPFYKIDRWDVTTEPTPSSDDVNAIAHQLYCPVCENTPLDECNTDACRQWRDLIYQFLLDGKTEDEIIHYFSVTYGNRVLPVPPAKGFNWLVYVVPPLVVILGLLLLYRSLRVWKKPGNDAKSISGRDTGKKDEVDNSYIEKFENELRK